MNQLVLLLLFLSLWGLVIVQPLIRSIQYSEPTLKLILAILIGASIALLGFINTALSPFIIVIVLIGVAVFILTPILLNQLVKGKRYRFAKQLNSLVYWTKSGRKSMQRFLARAALQRSDARVAHELLDAQDPQRIQAYALQQNWEQVLVMPATSLEAHAARIEAFIAQGQLLEAEYELSLLKQNWEKIQTPEGYRLLTLSETRLAAERGNIDKVQKNIQSHLVGLPAYLAFALLARVAETSHNLEAATQLYTQAYLIAPESQRSRYATKLQDAGQPLPEIMQEKTAYGTYALLMLIVVAFLIQLWLENRYGSNIPIALAAFFVDYPEVPESTARWRYVSYAFVHGGIAHIAFNAWALFSLGRIYESKRNWANLLASFVLGAIMGAYFVNVAQGGQACLVGASGGVFAVAGSLLADTLRSRTMQDRYITRSLIQMLAVNALIPFFIPFVSMWGHIGGFVGGLLWGFIRQGLPKSKRIDWFAGGLSIGIIVYALVSVVDYFFRYK